MSWYTERVLPHIVNLTCGGARMVPVRRPALEGLHGTVLEVGFGSGSNVGLYPAAVERVLAVEPSLRARELAAKRLAAHPSPPVTFVGLDGESLPVETSSVDAVLSTFTLCTIPDVRAAMAEIARVLRPGGALHFLEHGLAEDPKVQARQRRFEPVQRRIAGGCHLTRDPAELATAAGLRVERLDRFRIQGPKILTAMSCGTAVRPT
ncbi:MAG: class I SAM-dependent methyltransferase [Acidimicrobiia bacterium]